MKVKTLRPTAGQNGIRVAPRSAATGCDAEVHQPKPQPGVAEGNYTLPPLRNTEFWSKISCTFSQALSGCRTPKHKFSTPAAFTTLRPQAAVKHYLDKTTTLLSLNLSCKRSEMAFMPHTESSADNFVRFRLLLSLSRIVFGFCS